MISLLRFLFFFEFTIKGICGLEVEKNECMFEKMLGKHFKTRYNTNTRFTFLILYNSEKDVI